MSAEPEVFYIVAVYGDTILWFCGFSSEGEKQWGHCRKEARRYLTQEFAAATAARVGGEAVASSSLPATRYERTSRLLATLKAAQSQIGARRPDYDECDADHWDNIEDGIQLAREMLYELSNK